MRRYVLLLSSFFIVSFIAAQKKPLDHSVYDGWQSIGEKMISNDGKWVVYTIDVQQGDNELVIQSSDAKYKKTVPRGYNALITEDSRYVVFKIRPFYKDTREAKIKKKKPEDFPKDSLAIVELGKEEIWKTAKVKTYKTPQKSFGWVAYHLEKKIEPPVKAKAVDSNNNKKTMDSLNRIIDSLETLIRSIPIQKRKNKVDDEMQDADGDETSSSAETGTDLILRKLETGEERTFLNVAEFYFNKTGEKLLIKISGNEKDSPGKTAVILYDIHKGYADTLSRGGNDFRNFVMTDDGIQVAYVEEREAKPKDLPKTYKLWYYKEGMDSAVMIVNKTSTGMTVSENGNVSFSKSGKRLFFGTAYIQPAKDTTLVEFEHPKLDIWHYKDDYLQTVQTFPARLQNDLKENFLAVYDVSTATVKQLGSKELPQIIQTNEGDGETFIGVTDFGKRIESQWTGNTNKDIYAINVKSGAKKLIKENLYGQVYPSSTGKYILWYDRVAKNYFAYDGNETRNITAKIKVPLWNEESELPDYPNAYGIMGWGENDSLLYIYDRYDIWQIDATGKNAPETIWKDYGLIGRNKKITFRYIKTDLEEKFIPYGKELFIKSFDNNTKEIGLSFLVLGIPNIILTNAHFENRPYNYSTPVKAKDTLFYIYTKENFKTSPNIYINKNFKEEQPLSSINPQQKDYNWGTAELFKWKAFDGKEATGILYKPEDFDPKKKYPMICYFYETLSNNLNTYYAPAPIRSAINIPFFVSRGYIIFLPDIHYGTGHPGKDAYNYVVSGARALVKKGFVDSTRMAQQAHSWGGYQVAEIITMTKLFKAAWAGAPVANMTSAYGGIRWESGVSRQWQYEKAQSRIGATLWQKPQLYIDNSPLFHLDKVTTPLVIMSNDADGAVPWYQGIELFTAMRRLNKKVWMFNYNGQGHGLTQRQDMRDYQIRMQQFFDWILKGEKPAKWITEGVPAIKKGKDWGLETAVE